MRFFWAAIFSIAAIAPAHALRDIVIIQNLPAPPDHTLRLVTSDPASGQTLQQAPAQVALTFSQPVRVDKSFIRVTDMYGTRLTDDITSVDGNTIAVALPPLNPGRYSVKWRVRCQCDQDTELSDIFRFNVR